MPINFIIGVSDYKISGGDYIIGGADYIITVTDYRIYRHLDNFLCLCRLYFGRFFMIKCDKKNIIKVLCVADNIFVIFVMSLRQTFYT